MPRLSARNQMIIAAAAILVLAVVVVLVGIMPLFKEAGQIGTLVNKEKRNLQTAQNVVARRQAVKASSAANEVELMRIANQVPDGPQLPSVIIELQDAANILDLDFPQFQVGNAEEGAPPDASGAVPFHAFQITLTVEGDWDSVIEYHRRLHNLNRGVRVLSLSLTGVTPTPESGEDETTVNAAIVLEVYAMPSATTGPQAEQVGVSQ